MLHSLGPWKVDGCCVRDVSGNVVCQSAKPEDAKLIAQAPELLRLIREITEDEGNPDSTFYDDVTLAIGRAEGTRG